MTNPSLSSQLSSSAAVEAEIATGQRFSFGENWRHFLLTIDDQRIDAASRSLVDMLGEKALEGRRFLDAGSGSGLSSLAARRLGARVHSFDYDPQSVACSEELRCRYSPGDPLWTIERGSVLDATFLEDLGAFDVVYSWGVLHHTGDMWAALDLIAQRVAPEGRLYLAIYNDQGWISAYWRSVKRIFNSGPAGRWTMIVLHAPYLVGARLLVRALTGRLRIERGMSLWYDMLDWLGGWPFETATPRALEQFFAGRGFRTIKMRTVGRRHGCNEIVFRRSA